MKNLHMERPAHRVSSTLLFVAGSNSFLRHRRDLMFRTKLETKHTPPPQFTYRGANRSQGC
jgi:hypothetical protein